MNISSLHKILFYIKEGLERITETTVVIPVVLTIMGLLANFLATRALKVDSLANLSASSGLSGLVDSFSFVDNGEATFLENISNPFDEQLSFLNEGDDVGSIIVGDSAVLNTGNPESSVIIHRDGLVIYKVQKGDTLSKIAANFNINLDTIYTANKGLQNKSLSLGQEITILPISGIIHQVKDGESLSSLASLYSISESKIIKYNSRAIKDGLAIGSNIIIPGVKSSNNSGATSSASLPNFPGYYAMPTTGWNWGKLHNKNAVDIANACGTPIYASAEGLIIDVKSGGNWSEGYGNYIIIEHPNGTKTRYAHNERNVVSAGDYVVQGDTIAYIGNTGLTHGPTGCHVHFEVVGARNPFAK